MDGRLCSPALRSHEARLISGALAPGPTRAAYRFDLQRDFADERRRHQTALESLRERIAGRGRVPSCHARDVVAGGAEPLYLTDGVNGQGSSTSPRQSASMATGGSGMVDLT
jgi:hypothetical protein